MKFSYTFIDRPILAGVISVFILLLGGLAYFTLPVSQYPEVVPPTVNVRATYPGADAKTVAETLAAPLEQEVNGVEGMLYMTSQSTSDGTLSLDVTFDLGTDLDQAVVFVQNRVARATPRLPQAVRTLGVTTTKRSPDLLMVVHLLSPDGRYNTTYLGNYAYIQLRDGLSRFQGIGDVSFFGTSAYAMRIWLNPDKIAALNITAAEVLSQLRAQNLQVASGILNQSPIPENQNAFEINIRTKGRLSNVEEFENTIIKTGNDGSLVLLRDIARVEIGAESYTTRARLGQENAVGVAISQRPGTNAVETAEQVKQFMEESVKDFPPGLEYKIEYNPTTFVEESVNAVLDTLLEAIVLVIIVILVFLQSWRAALIPVIAIPISLVGTFAVMQAFGFTLNNLSLFGLVLAIGIVVDDAIVVVENVERRLADGDESRDAARNTMKEVGSALISIGLVLVAVFLPTMFLGGISGQFFKQFGLTIAVSTTISVFVSLTLSPALARLLLKPKSDDAEDNSDEKTPWWRRPWGAFTDKFNSGMDKLSDGYGNTIGSLGRKALLVFMVYLGLMLLTVLEFSRVPSGFIPAQDQGYLISTIQLPSGASLSRTETVMTDLSDKILEIDGVRNTVVFAGLNGATSSISSNAGAIFTILDDFEERGGDGSELSDILANMNKAVSTEDRAVVNTLQPPPVRGIGNGSGFKMMVQDQGNRGLDALSDATNALVAAARNDPSLANVFTVFNTDTPQLFMDIDRERAQKLGVPVSEVFSGLETFIGSSYVNDFNYLGKTYRVTAQADGPYRLTPEDVLRIKVRNNEGEMMPLGSIATFNNILGPDRVQRFNLLSSAAISGETAEGYSSGEALTAMERLAEETLPDGFTFEWTEIAYQQKQSEGTAAIAFGLAVLFVFLLLAAQFESLIIPLSIVLIVPMGLLAAITGMDIFGVANDILTQIGMVVLIGLACKNAILIIEFAVQLEEEGQSIYDAAQNAARLRLRPILMTSLAFILGVVPLVIASGPGSEMRNVLGIAVLIGMIGVSFFGVFFTPVFYVLCRRLTLIGASQEKKDRLLSGDTSKSDTKESQEPKSSETDE